MKELPSRIRARIFPRANLIIEGQMCVDSSGESLDVQTTGLTHRALRDG